MILILIFEKHVVMIYTSHKNIYKTALDSMPIISVISMTQFIEGTGQGTIKAIGYQTIASLMIFISMWIIALPCALIFCFYLDMGQRGLWLGYLIGQVLISISYSVIILSADWGQITKDAVDRFKHEKHD